eukprot:g797.t1
MNQARKDASVKIASTVQGHSELAEAATAMLSGCLWNFIYHPTQLGPFVTVSRSFTAQPYELFEWDTYFGAAMLAFAPELLPLALSSAIQITKSKTMGPLLDGHGFVPGYSKGGRWLSEDRTERPVGSQIILRIFKRWHGVGGRDLTWVLALLYPDLLDWHLWLWRSRRIAPLGLGGLGSDPCVTPNSTTLWCKQSWGMGNLQGARFESLDNSPMYDAPDGYSLWDNATHRMRLYDVGQSAAIVAECEALAAIAGLIGGHDADVAMLQAHQKELGGLISEYMWVEPLGVFSNVLLNGSFYPRIAPTSFYPMLAGIATDEQAETLVRAWLTNSTRFCVPVSAAAWPPAEQKPQNQTCFWGMPSISADDPAYMASSYNYWRGFNWAPQSLLVYLGLTRYSHLKDVKDALAGLSAQQLELMLSVWRARHHICENYPSVLQEDAAECTGNWMYIWGGLPALIALIQAGLY